MMLPELSCRSGNRPEQEPSPRAISSITRSMRLAASMRCAPSALLRYHIDHQTQFMRHWGKDVVIVIGVNTRSRLRSRRDGRPKNCSHGDMAPAWISISPSAVPSQAGNFT